MAAFVDRPSAFGTPRTSALAFCLAVAVRLASLHAHTPPPRAQVGPLQASVARSESGACQLRLLNVGDTTVVAWTVTVQSEDARYVSAFRHDGWRDAFHLPTSILRLPSGETRSFTVNEEGALGDLTVRIHFLALTNGVAYGMSESAAYVGPAAAELTLLVERRRRQAAEALAVVEKVEAALAEQGVAKVLASKLASSILETDGDWNWWRVSQDVKAAETLRSHDPKAAAALSAALDLLREAHRQGNTPITLTAAEPMAPLVAGNCTP